MQTESPQEILIMWALTFYQLLDVQLMLKILSESRSTLPYANSISDKFIAVIENNLETKDCISAYQITHMLAGLRG
jgi:hypothetical protein